MNEKLRYDLIQVLQKHNVDPSHISQVLDLITGLNKVGEGWVAFVLFNANTKKKVEKLRTMAARFIDKKRLLLDSLKSESN